MSRFREHRIGRTGISDPALLKSTGCGANDEGGGGFQAGNTCAAGDKPKKKGKAGSRGKDLPDRKDRAGGLGERAMSFLFGTDDDKDDIEDRAVGSVEQHKAMLRESLEQLPPGMIDLAGENIKKVVLHENLGKLNTELESRIGDQKGVAFGFWTERGELHLDGPIPEKIAAILDNSKVLDPAIHQRSVYVHELAHAVEKLEDGTMFTDTEAWTSAWKSEINADDVTLSRYAQTNPSEGFAEFVRYYTEDPKDARASFPKSTEAVEKVYGRL